MSSSSTFDSHRLAVLAEHIDTQSWFDQHAAQPPHVRQGLATASQWEHGLAMVRGAIPFSHFNMVLTLGCPAVVNDGAFKAIDAFYAGAPAGRHWVLVNDHSQPADLAQQLQVRGYTSDGAWDRVVMIGAQPERWAALASGCEEVDRDNQAEWSEFIRSTYGMPTLIVEALQALVGRIGWVHMLRREGGRPGGRVVVARSLFMNASGWAWLGIDVPVPGLMAPSFLDDRHVCAALLMAAARAGAHSFVSDVEAIDDLRAGPAYRSWTDLGFEPVYRRRLFVRDNPPR